MRILCSVISTLLFCGFIVLLSYGPKPVAPKRPPDVAPLRGRSPYDQPKFSRSTAERLQELTTALERREVLNPEKRASTCISLLTTELFDPSQPGWGSNGGPIDSGYVQEVIMGSVCTYAQRGKDREAIRIYLRTELANSLEKSRYRDCLKIMLGFCGDREMIPVLVRFAAGHSGGYMRSSAALALSSFQHIQSIPEFRQQIPALKSIMLTDTYARIRPSQRGHRGKRWEVYSPVKEAIAAVLHDLGQPTESTIIDTKYGIKRAERLLQFGDKKTRERTVEILKELRGGS